MINRRKKIAIVLFGLFVFSRALDIFATWYYSPDLAYEGNPSVLYLGSDWTTVFIMQLLGITIIGLFCFFRINKKDYSKKSIGESFLKKKNNSAAKRFSDDITGILTITFAGFIVFIIWILSHGLYYNLDIILDTYIGSIPMTLPFILFIGFILSKPLANYITNNYVNNEL